VAAAALASAVGLSCIPTELDCLLSLSVPTNRLIGLSSALSLFAAVAVFFFFFFFLSCHLLVLLH
jgi:hypothetical protein